MKSLKKFTAITTKGTKLIEGEVNKWKISDCAEYIKKHNKDKNNSSMTKKLEIVKSHFSKEVRGLSLNDCFLCLTDKNILNVPELRVQIEKIVDDKTSGVKNNVNKGLDFILKYKKSPYSTARAKSEEVFQSVESKIKDMKVKDCLEYLDKFNKDNKVSQAISTGIKEKIEKKDFKKCLNLLTKCESNSQVSQDVAESISQRIDKLDINGCCDYIESVSEVSFESKKADNLIKKVYKRCTDLGVKEKNGNLRKLALNHSNPPIEKLKEYAPKSAFVEKSIANEWGLDKSMCDTGVLLWKNGYNVDRFIGAGSFGVVWACDGKAVKVGFGGSKDIENEDLSVSALQKLFEDQATDKEREKLKKHLNNVKSVGGGIYEALLAISDLRGAADKYCEKNYKVKTGKTIRSVLNTAVDALNAVVDLHKAGFSHNDIKPENFLKIKNFRSATEKLKNLEEKLAKARDENNSDDIAKYENILQIHLQKGQRKHITQLGDFGAMSEINDTKSIAGTPGYMAPDILTSFESKVVEKRDSYSLGVTFLFLLTRYTGQDEVEAAKILRGKSPEATCKKYKFFNTFSGSKEEDIKKFVEIIKNMLAPSSATRLSVEDAQKKVKKLKDGLKDKS